MRRLRTITLLRMYQLHVKKIVRRVTHLENHYKLTHQFISKYRNKLILK